MKFVQHLFIFAFWVIASSLYGQNQGGENCATATDLGPLGDETSCPGGAGFSNENTNNALVATHNPSCDRIGSNYDLWYSFVAPASGIIQLNVTLGTAVRVEAAIYSSCTVEVECSSSHSNGWMVMGLTPDHRYLLQLWTDDFARGTFDFCVFAKDDPPMYDECSGAELLNVMTNNDPCMHMGNGTMYNNFGTSASGTLPLPDCGNFGLGIDVWHKFVVPSTGDVTIEITEAIGPQDWALAIYSGDCTSLAQIACDDDSGTGLFPRVELTGRTPGDTLYVRVWEIGGDEFGSYRLLCSTSNTSPPDNNDCSNAIDLTSQIVNPGSCSSVCGHNVNATPSGETPVPTCGSFGSGSDVWYKITVNDQGGFNLKMQPFATNGPQDWVMAAYTGSCGSLTEIACDDDSGIQLYPSIHVAGLAPGTEVFVRIWEYGADEEGPFELCYTSISPLAINDLTIIGKSVEEGNMLSWSYLSDEVADQVEIYASLDGKDWEGIHTVKPGAQSATGSFLHRDPQRIQYYKIVVVEGSEAMESKVISVLRTQGNDVENAFVYPMPAQDQLDIYWSLIQQGQALQVKVYDLNGRQIDQYGEGDAVVQENGRVSLDIHHWPHGHYFVQVRSQQRVQLLQCIKQ